MSTEATVVTMYEQLLGPTFKLLPNPVRALHSSSGAHRLSGVCTVRRGDSLLSRLFARAMALPPAGVVEVAFTVEAMGAREVWIRRFGRHCMRSKLQIVNNRLQESVGLVNFVFALLADGERVRWVLEEVRALGVSVPTRWFDLDVFETERDGRYHFNVNVNIRGVGLLVHYAGWLA